MVDIHVDTAYVSGYLVSSGNYYLKDGRSYRIKKFEGNILNEVHIYLKAGGKQLKHGTVVIPLSDIGEIQIVEKDRGKTAASYTFGTFGIPLGVVAIFAIIVALTKSSCPYVYAHDGEAFIFEGETFGGAIAST